MATLFISDLHLTAERPATIALFRRFLSDRAATADALYILGDLFEAWLGDDLILPGYEAVIEALRQLTAAGVPVYIMHGNRDFLLGEAFERATGCRLLAEGSSVEVGGVSTVLLHGDSLCTDDLAYQQLRRMLRDPAWIADFIGKPIEERIALARGLREKSAEEVGGKDYAIMDVNDQAVSDQIRRSSASRLIHGHTHRPGLQRHSVDGRLVERFVLGEWADGAEIVICEETGCRLERFE